MTNPTIESLAVAAYTAPTDGPEGDGRPRLHAVPMRRRARRDSDDAAPR